MSKETKLASTDWSYQKTAGHEIHGQAAVYDESGKDIAIVYDGEAHARLIAAAPELAEALQIALIQLGEHKDGMGAAHYHAVNIASAALAKAGIVS